MFTSVDPATGNAGTPIPELSAEEIERKLARAAETYRAWRLTDLPTRTRLLEAIADRFEADKQRLAAIATREMGKTLKSAVAEVEKCVAGFRYYARQGEAMLAPRVAELADGTRATSHWQPMGPVLAVMPWNFPYWQVVRFLAPTIMAGNVGLLKHASLTQGCGAAIEEAVLAAGAPAGLFQNLAIKAAAVDALIGDDRVVAVTLTGSEEAGAKVAAAAGRALKKVVLELGGSDPFIVMPSADIDAAVATAVTARTQNNGQSCIASKRFLVHADVYERFTEAFTAAMAGLTMGDPLLDTTDVGPVATSSGRDDLIELVDDARAKGADILTGGVVPDGPGWFYPPTVVAGVTSDMRLHLEETFGPVATIYRVADVDEAIELANVTTFGLSSVVWSNDEDERARFVDEIDAGAVFFNGMTISYPELPFGGIKNSGYGRELGAAGIREFCNLKTVWSA